MVMLATVAEYLESQKQRMWWQLEQGSGDYEPDMIYSHALVEGIRERMRSRHIR